MTIDRTQVRPRGTILLEVHGHTDNLTEGKDDSKTAHTAGSPTKEDIT